MTLFSENAKILFCVFRERRFFVWQWGDRMGLKMLREGGECGRPEVATTEKSVIENVKNVCMEFGKVLGKSRGNMTVFHTLY